MKTLLLIRFTMNNKEDHVCVLQRDKTVNRNDNCTVETSWAKLSTLLQIAYLEYPNKIA